MFSYNEEHKVIEYFLKFTGITIPNTKQYIQKL